MKYKNAGMRRDKKYKDVINREANEKQIEDM